MQVYVITINSTHIHTCMQINTNLHMFFNHLYDIIKQTKGQTHVSTLVFHLPIQLQMILVVYQAPMLIQHLI